LFLVALSSLARRRKIDKAILFTPFTMAQAHNQTDYEAKKSTPSQNGHVKIEGAHQIAEHGHAATDM